MMSTLSAVALPIRSRFCLAHLRTSTVWGQNDHSAVNAVLRPRPEDIAVVGTRLNAVHSSDQILDADGADEGTLPQRESALFGRTETAVDAEQEQQPFQRSGVLVQQSQFIQCVPVHLSRSGPGLPLLW